MGQLGESAVRVTRIGSQGYQEWLNIDKTTIIEKVLRRATDVVEFLHAGLSEKVYTDSDMIAISHCRKLLDLTSVISKIELHSAPYVASMGWNGFLEAAKFLEMPDMIPDSELRIQYREFVRRLEKFRQTEKNNKQLLSMFLNPKNMLYKDVEFVLAVLARATMVKGVEAIVESWVSVMENHTPSTRGITDQDRLINELWVAINGPEPWHCEGVVKEAMAKYWASQQMEGNRLGHFIRRSDNIKSYLVSEVVDNLVKQPPRLPFML